MLKRVGIIGAGISGLTSGYALREQGLEVDLYEMSGSINEFGVGITLSMNATSLLRELGLFDSIAANGVFP